MDKKTILLKALQDYHRITGLRGYIIEENQVLQSAGEKNYFCKCLKCSQLALQECETCMEDTYKQAMEASSPCSFSCHAGLIKWAIPIFDKTKHYVIISEGILANKQLEEAPDWIAYLADTYNLDKDMLLHNYNRIRVMDEMQMSASIQLLQNLLYYHLQMHENEE